MSDISARLALPYLQPAQAQKHVTHNEALARLDILVQLTVEEFGATEPPALPEVGAVHALGSGAGGDWAGHDGELAAWIDGMWLFIAPREGWRAWGRAEGDLRVWDGSAWLRAGLGTLDLLGINAAADTTNRLAVAAPATLLTHDGSDHRLKIDKAAASDTASLLFQTGFSGRAEMGTTGSDDFAIRVSTDGSAWTTAMTLEAATGRALLNDVEAGAYGGAGVTQAPDDTTAGRLLRADHGYSRGNLLGAVAQSGGTPSGAVIERGANSNGEYVRFADGTQICTRTSVYDGLAINTASGALYRHDGTIPHSATMPAAFTSVDAAGVEFMGSDSSTIRNNLVSCRFGFFQGGETFTPWSGLQIFTTRSTAGTAGEKTTVKAWAIGRWF